VLNGFEKIVSMIYRESKPLDRSLIPEEHLDDETLACLFEDKLPPEQRDSALKHLIECGRCAECLSAQLEIQPHLSKDVPVYLLERVRRLVLGGMDILEILLNLKERAWEIIQAGGDVLVGQELVPAPVLRSRQIDNFKDSLSIIKDLRESRVLVKLESKGAGYFNLSVDARDKQGREIKKDLRMTLKKSEIELESYLGDGGVCVFENLKPGDYNVEIIRGSCPIAIIDLKVKA